MRWGLVGTGAWARMVHAPSLAAPSLAAPSDQPRLVAVWGRDPSRSAALAQEHGVRAATTIEDLFDDVDAVSFAVAPVAQAPLARMALDRGLRVLLEKPLATETEVVRQFAEALPAGARAVVFLTRLFEPVRARWLREALDGGYTSAHVELVSAALSEGSVYAGSQWRRGSGVIWDLMPHVLSQVVPVLGDVVDGSIEPWPAHDGVVVVLRHLGDRSTRVRMTLTARPEQREEWIRFEGPQGTTRSPAGALDFAAAHLAAVQTVEADTDLRHDELLRMATVEAAVEPTELMSTLVRDHEHA